MVTQFVIKELLGLGVSKYQIFTITNSNEDVLKDNFTFKFIISKFTFSLLDCLYDLSYITI